jgi:hypothetical protein
MLQRRGSAPRKGEQHTVAAVDFQFSEIYENTELYSKGKYFVYLRLLTHMSSVRS